jgi:hypothetical protein
MRVVSRVEDWKGLSRGSFLGFVSKAMMIWVRVWGVPVRLVTMEVMSTCVSCQCEQSAFARGCIFR